MATTSAGERTPAYRIPDNVDMSKLLQDAKDAFYKDPNVIGVGIGNRRKGDEIHHDEVALVVYVKTKLAERDVDTAYDLPWNGEPIAV